MGSEEHSAHTTVVVREATRRDWGGIVALFAQAAAFDSMFIGLGRSEAQRSRFFRAYLKAQPIRRLKIDVACDRDGNLIGAALWERLDVGRDSAVLAQIPYMLHFVRALGIANSFRGVRLQHQLERHRPIEPHWYLKNIVVAEHERGATVGSSMLVHHLDALDRTGQFAYLEARDADQQRFFERFGFVQGGLIDGRQGRRFTGMFRNPGPSSRHRRGDRRR
jgi:ribosomal protein S18 acetylase RimI-like enzyme